VASLSSAIFTSQAAADDEATFPLAVQSQYETAPGSGRFQYRVITEQWVPAETAIIVCDVWDAHHSINAVERLEEFAPRLNDVLTDARERGITIIHSPSDCMPAYADHIARKRAINAPQTAHQPHDIGAWCSAIPAEERAVYPIDQSDGGDDDDPNDHVEWAKKLTEQGRNPNLPWQRQSDLITIDAERDFISDKGDEVWNVLESRGIKNVILTGVHVNMCVLGRPFGLRQMARNGKNVVLMRDMTDTMYNPKQWPYVSHFTGNDLIVSHIERYICPTITSDQLIGGETFSFSKDTRPHVVMLIAEDPYDTKTSLPGFARDTLGKDFKVTILHGEGDTSDGIPGLWHLRDADMLVVSVRRRTLPPEQMNLIRDFVKSGKPVIGLRTASHAFALREGSPPEGQVDWPEFDAEVFGGNYSGSYPDELRSTIRMAPTDKTPTVLGGVTGLPFVQGGHMYKTGPLASSATLLLEGVVKGHDPEPVAWMFRRPEGGTSYYIALGHPDDFQQSAFIRLLANCIYSGTETPIPQDLPKVDHTEEYRRRWVNMPVPATPATTADAALKGGKTPLWYRCVVRIPQEWAEEKFLRVYLGSAGDTSQTKGYFNGYALDAADEHSLTIASNNITPDDHNLLVLRVDSTIGVLSAAPVLQSPDGKKKLSLAGTWQMRMGDDETWKNMPLPSKFGGAADIVFAPPEPLWTARPVTSKGEFTPGIEGPACDHEGNLFAVNYGRQGTIGRVTPTGEAGVFVTLPEGSVGNGIRFNDAGNFYVADYTKHNVLEVDPRTKEITVHAHNDAMNQPNDLSIADDGTLYASDPNWAESTGQLWRIDTDGTTTLLAKDMGTTNGIDVSPDGKTLYVNESVQRNVWAFTITDKKTLTDKRLIKQFEDHGFDGMRVDVDGNLYISRYGKGTVVKMSPKGEILREINVLGPRPSNLCFGGPDGCTVYVTEVESTRLVSFRVDRPGRSWKSKR